MAEYAGIVMENIARNGVRSRQLIAQFYQGMEHPGIRDHEFYGETVDFVVSTDTSRTFKAVMDKLHRRGTRSREIIAQLFRGMERPGTRDHEFYGETVEFAVSTDTSRVFEATIGKLHRPGTRSRELAARLPRGLEHPGIRDNVSYGETVDFIVSDDTSRSGSGYIVFMRPVLGKIATHPATLWQSIHCGKRENVFKGESIASSVTQQELLESYIPRQWPLESAWKRARKASLPN